MDYKNRMILFFILIAIIPIAALSVVFTTTVIKFRDEMSIVYQGFVSNLEILLKNKADLGDIKANLVMFMSVQNESQKSARIANILELKASIDESIDDYKRIEDLPHAFNPPFGPVLPADRFNISKMVSDEMLLVNDINQQWSVYSSRIEDLSLLASDPSFVTQANAEANQLATLADTLISSYDSLVAVNGQIGNAMRERSFQTMQLAFLYGGIASAISAASATAAAILVSKRVVLGDIVRMTKLELVETTLRDLIGEGADALLPMIKNQLAEQPSKQVADVETVVVPSQEDIVIGRTKEPTDKAITRPLVEEYKSLLTVGQELKGKLVMINYSDNSKASPQAAQTLGQLFKAPNLILLTRKGSNFYRQAQGKYTVCVLGDGSWKSGDDNEQVVPLDDGFELGLAIEDLVKKNPKSTVLVDNATDLIYTLGFEKVFLLLRKATEIVLTYEDSSIVILINNKAHEPHVIEAVGNVSNVFIN